MPIHGGGGPSADGRTRGLSIAGMSNRRRASYAFPVNPNMLKRLSLADGPEISSDIKKPTLFDNTAYRQFQTYNHLSTTLLMEYDLMVRRKNILINILAFVGIILGVMLLELSWNHEAGVWHNEQGWLEFFLKLLSSITTIILLERLVSYYRFQHLSERRTWYIPDSLEWQNYKWVFLAMEIVICGIHPFPTGIGSYRMYDNTLATFLIFRVYLVVRLVRDYCPVYRQRAGIIASTLDRSTGNPAFNWVLTSRYFFRHYMWRTVLLGLASSLVVFAYGAFVLERTVDKSWTYGIALWNTAITMTTVGYGDYSPTWAGSQACQLLAAFSGILLTSLTIFVIIQSLEYSYVERRAYNRYKLHGISIRQRRLAARYIQFQWRRYMYLKKLAPTDTQGNRNDQFARYVIKNVALMSKLQHYRRQQTLILSEQRKHETKVGGGGNSDNVVDPTSGTITRRDSIALPDQGSERRRSRNWKGSRDSVSDSSSDSDSDRVTLDEVNDRMSVLDTSVTQIRTAMQTLQRQQDSMAEQMEQLANLPAMIQQLLSSSNGGEAQGGAAPVTVAKSPVILSTPTSDDQPPQLSLDANEESNTGTSGTVKARAPSVLSIPIKPALRKKRGVSISFKPPDFDTSGNDGP